MDFRHARPPPPQHPPPPDPHQPPPPPQQAPPPPGTWYSGQFQYPSPSPPPPQWAPQHSDHHLHPPPPPYASAARPPPMPFSSNPYSFPPRPHMPPPPHYPHVNQEWSNTSWGHQAQNKNEDDLAARARAWAASKAVTDDQQQQSQVPPANRPEKMNYQDQYSQNLDPSYQEFQQNSHPPPSYQQYPSSFVPTANHLQEPSSFSYGHFSYRDGNLRDPTATAAYSHQENGSTSLSVHQQEVPSSYSSVAGKEEARDINGNFFQPSHMPFALAPQHHQVQSTIPVDQPQYSFSNSAAESATDLSNQPLDFGPRYGHDHGPFGQSMPPVHPTGPQVDPSMGIPSPVSMHSGPLFGRVTGSSYQPTMQSPNTVFPVSNAFVFPGDTYGNHGFPDRPKKASVPNWLREEIIKKKSVIGNSALELSRQDTESNEDEVDQAFGRVDQVDGNGIESSRSTEEEDDDEDYAEAAKTAKINQEIKRILTEVLLKVTDELFDEIATKVLEEDNLTVEVEHKAIASNEMTSAAVITPKSSAKILIPTKTKQTDLDDVSGKFNSSSPGDVLGLGSYASDDDDEEKEVQNSAIIQSSNSSPPPVHLAENGGSQVDHSHGASPNGDNDNSGVEVKVKPDSSDVSKSNLSTLEAVNAEIVLPDDQKHMVKVKPDSSDVTKSNSSTIEAVNGEIVLPDDQKHMFKVKPDSSDVSKSNPGTIEAVNAETVLPDDDRYIKRAKKEDRNGTKEKPKDRDSEKKVNKSQTKDDKKERERDRKYNDKEESRKQERSKYKLADDLGRHKRRHHSPPPGGRGRSSKDSSSDDSRRRVHSKRRDLSPSPVRSRRQVSRSPPSKRSHHRHSNYSSLETTRERRRSRSRSRRR